MTLNCHLNRSPYKRIIYEPIEEVLLFTIAPYSLSRFGGNGQEQVKCSTSPPKSVTKRYFSLTNNSVLNKAQLWLVNSWFDVIHPRITANHVVRYSLQGDRIKSGALTLYTNISPKFQHTKQPDDSTNVNTHIAAI